MIKHDSGTAFGNSFEIQALSSPQTETVFNYLLPDVCTCSDMNDNHFLGKML
jgi:hypothetical protein